MYPYFPPTVSCYQYDETPSVLQDSASYKASYFGVKILNHYDFSVLAVFFSSSISSQRLYLRPFAPAKLTFPALYHPPYILVPPSYLAVSVTAYYLFSFLPLVYKMTYSLQKFYPYDALSLKFQLPQMVA